MAALRKCSFVFGLRTISNELLELDTKNLVWRSIIRMYICMYVCMKYYL
jgi:hypothetical protein